MHDCPGLTQERTLRSWDTNEKMELPRMHRIIAIFTLFFLTPGMGFCQFLPEAPETRDYVDAGLDLDSPPGLGQDSAPTGSCVDLFHLSQIVPVASQSEQPIAHSQPLPENDYVDPDFQVVAGQFNQGIVGKPHRGFRRDRCKCRGEV